MLSRSSDYFVLDDLKKLDKAKHAWFDDKEDDARAGRCLLDVLEFLRADLKLPGRFRQLTDAHTIRLVCRCLGDPALERKSILDRVKPIVQETYSQIRATRNDEEPFYGDDFWDWASVLDAFLEVGTHLPDVIDVSALKDDCDLFVRKVKSRVKDGLTVFDDGREWFGPATAVMAHRVLRRCRDRFGIDIDALLDPLREQALERVVNGKYRGRSVRPDLVLWHYGQVVAEFGQTAAPDQFASLSDLSSLEDLEKWDQVYALARVVQGVAKGNDQALSAARDFLGRCESLDRPLGLGLMGENIKGSLNVLEALWPLVDIAGKLKMRQMLDALLQAHTRANRVALLVAFPPEAEAAKKAFRVDGAQVTDEHDVTIIERANYQVVMKEGKGLLGSFDAVRTLIDKYKPKWLVMSGIAGSLGMFDDSGAHIGGPAMGDVVIATSLAPYRIYDIARETIKNAQVPLRGDFWKTIPTHPTLFRLAHEAAEALFKESGRYHEGLIVTGTGIKDDLKVKAEVLKEFPGGLAVEVEGYAVGLMCMVSSMPFIVIRGISDRAQGDKEKQERDPEQTKREQKEAAEIAADVTVRLIGSLSQQW
jgi:nucleoside phosphorylase